MELSKEAIEELRSFIVGSNLEYSLLEQLDDNKNERELREFLDLLDEYEESD